MLKVGLHDNWLFRQSTLNPDKIFLSDKNRNYSFSEVYQEVLSLAESLRDKTKPNKFVPVLCENNIHFVFAVFALWELGAVPVPVNYKLHKNEILELLSQFEYDYILLHKSLKEKSGLTFEKAQLFPFENKRKLLTEEKSGYGSLAVIIFTSGSRGKPKGVKISFENILASAVSFDSEFQISHSDKFLCSLPFYHIGGFSIITRAVLSGVSVVFPASLRTNDILTSIKEDKPTMVSLVPTMLKRLIDKETEPDNGLRYVFLGGAAAPDDLIEKAVKLNYPVTLVYGATETSSMVAAKIITKEKSKPFSVKPLKNVEIKIIDRNGKTLPPNCKGEIIVSAPQVAGGYLNNEGESKIKFSGKSFYTGDFGYKDDAGSLYILGRIDDIIISGGENINPSEIENVLMQHPEIKDAYIFGERSEEWGEQITAAVVTQNETLAGDEIKDFLRSHLSAFKIPKKIFFIDSIPRNSLGKVIKPELQKKLTSGN